MRELIIYLGMAALSIAGCVAHQDEIEKYKEEANNYKQKVVGTTNCGANIERWKFEGHEYFILDNRYMIHSESCPCKK